MHSVRDSRKFPTLSMETISGLRVSVPESVFSDRDLEVKLPDFAGWFEIPRGAGGLRAA